MRTIKKKQGSKMARQREELALTPEFGPWDPHGEENGLPHRAAVACTHPNRHPPHTISL